MLLEEKDGLSRALIQSAGGRPDAADKAADDLLAKRPKVEGGSGQLYMAPETARIFAEAEAGAKAGGDAFVTTERLLIAIAKEGGDYDWEALNDELKALRELPVLKDRSDIEIAAEDTVQYQTVITTMDYAIANQFRDVGFIDPASLSVKFKE